MLELIPSWACVLKILYFSLVGGVKKSGRENYQIQNRIWLPHQLPCSTNVPVQPILPWHIPHYWKSSILVLIGGCSQENNQKRVSKGNEYFSECFLTTYLLNNCTLIKENIWVNTLRTKNGGTWKEFSMGKVPRFNYLLTLKWNCLKSKTANKQSNLRFADYFKLHPESNVA